MSDGSRTTIGTLLERARKRLPARPGAEAAQRAAEEGALLLDIRSERQRRADGVIPGVPWYPRNVLEWRLDPASEAAVPEHTDLERPVILMCNEGYASSLAAATLQDLGFARATDLDGGFQAWLAAGLPVEPYSSDDA
jgi:rhodanese-related sulfurtransferase